MNLRRAASALALDAHSHPHFHGQPERVVVAVSVTPCTSAAYLLKEDIVPFKYDFYAPASCKKDTKLIANYFRLKT